MTIDSGYALACGIDIGGIKSVHMANKDDVTSMTLAANEEYYDTITMEAAKVFFKVEFESAAFTPNDDNSTVITIDLGKLSQESRDFIQDLKDCGNCGVIVIITDANDTQWVVGYDEKDIKENPVVVENSSGSTATRGEDTENTLNLVRLKNKLEGERSYVGVIPVV